MIIIPVSIFYFKKKAEYGLISREIDKAYITLLQNINNQTYFFNYDKTNPDFFISGNSCFLDNHKILNKLFMFQLEHIDSQLNKYNVHALIQNIYDKNDECNNTFNQISLLVYKRGFKDWGIEGKMRDNVHKLEDFNCVNQWRVLMLRRHEKDYIIRNEEVYINKLKKVGADLNNEITIDQSISPVLKDSILTILNNYLMYFDILVDLDKSTGIKDQTGLKKILDEKSKSLETLFSQLIQKVDNYTVKAYRELKIYYIIGSALIFTISIILSFMISKRITKPISILSDGITRFIKSEFSEKQHINVKNNDDEIGQLTGNFLILQKEIQGYIKDLNKKVAERTDKITKQKNKIELQKKQIEIQNDEVYKKNILIERQKQILEFQNKNLRASINYAKKIQDAILPNHELLDTLFTEYFILNHPKDIVSGDFYWTDLIKTKNRELIMIALADCTGHGVPGAFMSMLGVAAIHHAVEEEGKINPAHIVSSVNKFIYETLHKNRINENIKDGLDIAFCVLDKSCMMLEFSGTYRPLIIVRDNKLIEIKGEKIALGTTPSNSRKIKRQKIKVEANDMIYLFSDGYQDQFGGPNGKKFKYISFKNLLIETSALEINRQKTKLEEVLHLWKSNNYINETYQEQVDDILIIGFKI